MPEKFQTLPRDNVPMSQGDPTYQTPEKLQTLPRDNVPTIPLPSPLPPPTTSSPQLENVVDTPGYSEVPVNIKKVLSICVMRGRTHYSTHFRPIVTERRRAQHEVPK